MKKRQAGIHLTKAGVRGVAKEEITYVDRRYKIVYTHKNMHHARSLNVCNL